MKKGILLTLLIFLSLLCYAYYIHKTNDGLEFCQSCHVSPSKKLHQREYSNFTAPRAIDLAGLHRQKGKDFTCLSCHRGMSSEAALLNDVSAFLNLGKYLIADFDPEQELRFPLEKAVCQECHPLVAPNEATLTFHGLVAHKEPFAIECSACHLAHGETEGNKYYINEEFAIKICKKCHLNVTSEKFRKIIAIE